LRKQLSEQVKIEAIEAFELIVGWERIVRWSDLNIRFFI
jgi:hypothetical protein